MHIVAMVVALILAVTVVAVVLLTRPELEPAPAYTPNGIQPSAQEIACLEGGGTWLGFCSHNI